MCTRRRLALLTLGSCLLTLPVAAETFPPTPFNGMQVTFTVSGASLSPARDTHGFTTSRSYEGQLGTGVLRLSGAARIDSGYGADVSVTVNAGGESKEFSASIKVKESTSFDVGVPIPAAATGGSFSVRMTGHYNAGTRGLLVSGQLVGGEAAPTPSPSPAPAPSPSASPAPSPPPASPEIPLDQGTLEVVYDFLHQFDDSCFSGAVGLGDPETFRRSFQAFDVVLDPEQRSNAVYSRGALGGRTLSLSRDPRLAPQDWMLQQTIWHELIHHREDVNGDMDTAQSGNRDYDERNSEYAEVVSEQLLKLRRLEQNVRRDGVTPQARDQWNRIMERLARAEAGDGKTVPPSLGDLEAWTGIHARAGEIALLYASGACGGSLQDLAIPPPTD